MNIRIQQYLRESQGRGELGLRKAIGNQEICLSVPYSHFSLCICFFLLGSKLGKEYIKAVYCHPAYLTSMQSTSREMLG